MRMFAERMVLNTQAVIGQTDSVFINRALDGALALMSVNVSSLRASVGDRVVAKHHNREYWIRQCADIDRHVEVLQLIDRNNCNTEGHSAAFVWLWPGG